MCKVAVTGGLTAEWGLEGALPAGGEMLLVLPGDPDSVSPCPAPLCDNGSLLTSPDRGHC